MKICAAGILTVLILIGLLVSGAAAQDAMRLYVEEGVLESTQIRQLLALLDTEDASWSLMEEKQTLRELVIAGNTPDLAICSPAAARPWAKEGMLLPLSTRIPDQKRMQRQVLDMCVYGEELFMAPLIARHRQMAVNRTVFEALGMGYMLDRQTYPVWYPAQFYQILEEFMIRDRVAVDVWHAGMEDSAALEALTQAIFGGGLLSEDGRCCRAGAADMIAGVQWLADLMRDGMMGLQPSRSEALERFLTGETAIWIDWTKETEKAAAMRGRETDIVTMPYPSATGLPVRSFELTGVCAFLSGDSARDATLRRACELLSTAAEDVLGARGIWQDGALWPASLSANDTGATLRSLFCEALERVMIHGEAAAEALSRVQAAMDAQEDTQ